MNLRVFAVALVLCSPLAAASPARAADPPGLESAKKMLKTSAGVEVEAERGRLLVPENRAVAGSRPIAIGYLRLKSKAQSPRAPLFYCEGGPGSRAVSEHPRTLDAWAPMLAVADVVLIDQRGTNDSLLTWRWEGPPPLAFFVDADSALRHVAAMHERAGRVFKERGVDLAGYTTVESADDLDALRVALGLERISILGFSYGTHLATSYLRRHGAHVESAVLVGTEGPDHTVKLPWTMDTEFRRLSLLAAADPAIGPKVPDLMALYDRVIAKLAQKPAVIPVAGPGGATLPVAVGPFGLRYLLRIDVGDATDLVVFPRLLWSLEHGDTTELAWFVRKRAGGALGVHGMNNAMDFASGSSASRRKVIEEQSRNSRFADVVNFPNEVAASGWGLTPLGDDFRAPLVSPVRTLFISGELDFNTPPSQAEEVRWGMPNSTHLIVANAGHEQTLLQNETAPPVIVDFLKGMDVSARRITYPPLRFVPLEGPPASGGPSHPSVRR